MDKGIKKAGEKKGIEDGGEANFCTECGAMLKKDAKFCTECGAEVKKS